MMVVFMSGSCMLRPGGQCWTARTVRAAPAGGASEGPLGDGEVDDPPGALGEVAAEFAGAEQGDSDAFGERLGPGGESDCVCADHPGAVGGDVAATDRGEAEDQAGCHRGAEHQSEDVEQVAGAGFLLVEQRHPQRRPGDRKAGDRQDAACAAVPAPVAVAELGQELESAHERIEGGAHDVHGECRGEAGEPVVRRAPARVRRRAGPAGAFLRWWG
jgi:hypothetical protein